MRIKSKPIKYTALKKKMSSQNENEFANEDDENSQAIVIQPNTPTRFMKEDEMLKLLRAPAKTNKPSRREILLNLIRKEEGEDNLSINCPER